MFLFQTQNRSKGGFWMISTPMCFLTCCPQLVNLTLVTPTVTATYMNCLNRLDRWIFSSFCWALGQILQATMDILAGYNVLYLPCMLVLLLRLFCAIFSVYFLNAPQSDDNRISVNNPLTLTIWFFILPSSCNTFPC